MAETTSAKTRVGFIVRVLIGGGLLFFVLKWVDHEEVWRAVQHSNISVAIAFFPLLGLTGLIGAVRWRMLLECQEIDISLWEAIKLTLLGFFFCIFMPGLTGDVMKGFYAAKHTPHKTRAAISIVVDRLVGMVALGVVILVALLTCASKEIARKGMPIVIFLFVMCFVLLLVFFKGKAWGLDRLAKRFPLWGISEELVKAGDFYLSRKRTLLAAMLLSLIPHFSTIVLYYGYGLSLGIDQMTFTDYAFAVPVIGFISAMPISIMMGLGIGEWSAVWLFGINGVPKTLAVAVSLMVRASIVLWSLPGGVIALFYRTREKRG